MTTRKSLPGKLSIENDSDGTSIKSAVMEIQSKIINSPALNGGFDTLLFKVDRIEEAQGHLLEKTELIHTALYDPDAGLFTRVAEARTHKSEEVVTLEKEVHELKFWKQNAEKKEEQAFLLVTEKNKSHEMMKEQIADLRTSMSRYDRVVKWAIVALGGGGATLIGKLLYDFISGHIKFV